MKPGPRRSISQADIVDSAFEILEQKGFAAVSVRGVAGSLDRQTDGAERIPIPGTDAALVKREDGVWTLSMVRARASAASDAKAVTVTIDAMRERFPMNVAALGHQAMDPRG